MTIYLSTLAFTNNADIVPSSGTDNIVNQGNAYLLGGDDVITGTGTSTNTDGIYNRH